MPRKKTPEPQFDPEELDLLAAFEKGEWHSVGTRDALFGYM